MMNQWWILLFIAMQHSNMLLCCKVGDISEILPVNDALKMWITYSVDV